MSTNTITQYQQVSLSDMETLAPNTGARIAVTTQDQSYRVFISDGAQWNEMSNHRTDSIPYTFLTYSGATGIEVPCTPACHFDASDITTLEGVTNNSPVSSWKSLTGGHELTQNVLTDQPTYTNSNDPDNKFGVHMNTPGSGMQTNSKNNPQITGQTITFVVYKPIGAAGNQTELYRDISHGTAQPPVGNHYVTPWGSNNYQPRTSDTNDNIEIFHHNSNQHYYQYFGSHDTTHFSFPYNNQSDPDIGGIGKLAGYNQNFIDERQLSVVLTNPIGNGSSTSRLYYSSRTMWNSYWNISLNVNQSKPRLWRLAYHDQYQTPKYDGFRIGTRRDQSYNPFCMVNEVAVFNQHLTSESINNICNHLVNKWNISNWLPVELDAPGHGSNY